MLSPRADRGGHDVLIAPRGHVLQPSALPVPSYSATTNGTPAKARPPRDDEHARQAHREAAGLSSPHPSHASSSIKPATSSGSGNQTNTPRTLPSSPRLPSLPVPFSAHASPSQAGGGQNFRAGSSQNKVDEHIRRNAAGLLGIISRSSLAGASNPRVEEDAKSGGRALENGQHQSAASSHPSPVWWNSAVEQKADNLVSMVTFHGKAGAAVEALDGVDHILQQTLMVVQSRMSELTAKANDSKNSWGSLQDAVRDNVLMAKQVDQLKRERSGLERENMLLEEAANKLSGAAARSQLEINRLMAQVKALEEGQGRGRDADVQDLEDQMMELRIVCKNKDSDLRSSHARILELEKNLTEQQGKVRSLVQDLIQGQSIYATVETRAVESEARAAEWEARVAELEKSEQQASADLQKLEKQHIEAKNKLSMAVERIAQHERERAEEAAKAEEVVYALKKSVYRLKQRSENGSVMHSDSPRRNLERGSEESPAKSLERGSEADDVRSSPGPRQQVGRQAEVQGLQGSAAASSENGSEERDSAILRELTNELKDLRSQMDVLTKEREISPARVSAAPSAHVSASSEPSKIVFSSQGAAAAPADSRGLGGAGENASESARGGVEITRPAAIKRLDLSGITSQRATESNTASGAMTPRGRLSDARYDPPTGHASAREGYNPSQSYSRGDEPRTRPDDFLQRKSYSASNTPRAYDATPGQRFEHNRGRGSPNHGPAPDYQFKTEYSASRSPRQGDAQSEAARISPHGQPESNLSPRTEAGRSEQKRMMTLSESLAESWINLVSPRPTTSYTPPNLSPAKPSGATHADQQRHGSAHDQRETAASPLPSPRYRHSNSNQYTHDYSSSNGAMPKHISHQQPQQIRVGGDYHQQYDSPRGATNGSPYTSSNSHYQSTMPSPRGVDHRQHGPLGAGPNNPYQSTYGGPGAATDSPYQSTAVSPRGVDYRQYSAPGGASDGLTYSVVATPRTGTPVNGIYSPRGGGGAIASPRGRGLTVGGQPIVSSRAGPTILSPRGGAIEGSPRAGLNSTAEYMF